MKVILQKDVKGLGKKNDIVEVSDGYANNFLIKKGLAIAQNKGALQDLNRLKEEERKLDILNREQALQLKDKLSKIEVVFVENAGKEGKLHHAVTAKMIEDELKAKFNVEIDKRNIRNFAPLKAIGEAVFDIVLYKDITAKLHILIKESK